jgi:hypothetical protein
MTDTLPIGAINAEECIAAIQGPCRPRCEVSPDEVKSTVAQMHNAGLTDSDAWDAWIESLIDADWRKSR